MLSMRFVRSIRFKRFILSKRSIAMLFTYVLYVLYVVAVLLKELYFAFSSRHWLPNFSKPEVIV